MTWHTTPPAQRLLSTLTEQDLRISFERGFIGPDHMAFQPASEHGGSVFDRLEALRRADPIEAEFSAAETTEERELILIRALAVPSVAGVIGQRFGSANRFMGLDALDATRRFRAAFADVAGRVAA